MSKKTAIKFDDRERLIDLLRSTADTAGDRYNLTRLSGQALDEIEAYVARYPESDLSDWFERAKRHALADRIYTELDLLLKAKQVRITLPFTKKPITLNPCQGVRLPGMTEFQQVRFLAFTWAEYEAWRADQIARFTRASDIREIITLIDKVRMVNPDVLSVGAALQIGGAQITAVVDITAA